MKPNPRKVLQDLDIEDPLYKEKLIVLKDLIFQPNVGHIIPDHLIVWAKGVGFNVEGICESRTSWWSCNNR